MDKIKLLLLSIWYPLSISRYWENACKRNPNIDTITAGIYTGSWIPWMGGMNLLEKYAVPPTYVVPMKPGLNLKVDYELIRARMPHEWRPDIVLCVEGGMNWKNKPQEGIMATVATDAHCVDYSHARAISDYFFNMHPCYAMPEDHLLSYAYDPGVHYPLSIEKDTDAVIIGMPYDRQTLIDRITAQGVSAIFETGVVFDEYREIANRARIGLNWSSMYDTNARVFETMAMKLCLVTNRTPDLITYGFEEDRHYLGWSTLDEAVEKVLWAKNHPDEANAIALAGYNKVTREAWTYDRLLIDILKEVGLYE